MNDLFVKYPRLLALLDQLCEETLDESGTLELSQLVTQDPEACQLYVQYLDLHASLQWDLALPLLPNSNSPSVASAHEVDPQMAGRMLQLRNQLLEEACPAGRSTRPSAALAMATLSSPPASSFSEQRSRLQKIRVATGVALVFVMLAGGLLGRLWLSGKVTPVDQTIVEQQEKQQADLQTKNQQELTVADEKNPLGDQAGDLTNRLLRPVPGQTSEQQAIGDLLAEDDLPLKLPTIHWDPIPHHQRTKVDSDTTAVEQVTPQQSLPVALNDQEMVQLIDQKMVQYWDDLGVTPSPVAEDHEWVRRVYLDLSGRVPTLAELREFVESSESDRHEKLVTRLLESADFDLQWSTRWTNTLVGRTPNEQVDRIALQQYLREMIRQDQPWSQVVSDLIAAEGDPRENGAANFLVAHLNNQAVPATAFVARTLLGTQIHCAQCHKHPFYAVSQQEFWELNSFFKQATVVAAGPQTMLPGSSKEMKYRLTDRNVGGPTYYETRSGVMRVAYPKFNGQEVDASHQISRRQKLAEILVQGDNPLIAQSFVNRTWAQLFGYGFATPVDDLGPHNPPHHPELFQALSEAFVRHDYDIKRLMKWICLARPYRLSSQMTAQNRQDQPATGTLPAFSHMYQKPLSAEQLYDSLLTISGQRVSWDEHWRDYVTRREEWVLQFVNSLQNDENDEASHFEGTISQALVMMNGDLVERTISASGNQSLAELISAGVADQEKFEQICLTVLSRQPRAEELAFFRKIARPLKEARHPAERQLMLAQRLEDMFWAYLNSSEFIINH